MTTTINTTSKNIFDRIRGFLKSKKVSFSSIIFPDDYTIKISDLTTYETEELIKNLTTRLRLKQKSQNGVPGLAA